MLFPLLKLAENCNSMFCRNIKYVCMNKFADGSELFRINKIIFEASEDKKKTGKKILQKNHHQNLLSKPKKRDSLTPQNKETILF